ncbi:hypothetical protein CTI12_AA442600 [Artemisia annua]|uniref:Uncharacterized protein n=1 Tax=Artemisia annua TaxID=35608 RepID=A0A2U1LXH1_ARTAN|nr:hypothetical protein CTI12_AA442600 [Artemisia annua]
MGNFHVIHKLHTHITCETLNISLPAVLKGNSSVSDKVPVSSPSLVNQHLNERLLSGNAHRFVRQLYAAYLQLSACARKPLTIQEADQINEWRFSKLKEYKDRNIEIENEAFDRYLHDIGLLEEVFVVRSKSEEPTKDDQEGKSETQISNLKMKLRTDLIGTQNLRDRMRFITNNALRKLKIKTPTGYEEPELVSRPKKARQSNLVELNKKLSTVRTDEDLKSCKLLKSQLSSRSKSKGEQSENINTPDQQHDGRPEQKSESSRSNWFSTITIDQRALSHIDAQLSALEVIEYL